MSKSVKVTKKPVTPEPAMALRDKIANDIRDVAAKYGIAPSELKRDVYDTKDNGHKFQHSDFARVGGYGNIMRTYFPALIAPGEVVRLAEVQRGQRELTLKLGSRDVFFDELKKIMSVMPKVTITPYKPNKDKSKDDIERALSVVVSDLHIGSDLDPEETGNTFGIIEEARMVALLTKTVCEYKLQHRDATELHVWMLGDIIQNILHGMSSAALLHMQTCRAMWLLQQMIAQFAKSFKKVHVYCLPGNHGRDTAIHPKRAIHMKYNALETTIYYGIYLAVKDNENIIWHQPKSPWADVTILGHRMYGSHGDTNFSLGNPGKKLAIAAIEEKINRINASLADRHEYQVFIGGHVHAELVTRLGNGAFLVVNGPGLPPDAFANSLDIYEGPQVQTLFETTKAQPVGDFRMISLAESAKDASLDELIKPWPGLP